MKPAHYRGTYHRQAAALRKAANANPNTRCWRCGRTLAEHPPRRDGTPAKWTAGHVHDGEPGGNLQPEADVCNYAAGANLHRRKSEPSRRW